MARKNQMNKRVGQWGTTVSKKFLIFVSAVKFTADTKISSCLEKKVMDLTAMVNRAKA